MSYLIGSTFNSIVNILMINPKKQKKQFAKVYDKNIDKIYRFVFLKVSSSEIAEDLTAQVFTKGWNVFRKRDDIENPVAYLYQIARTEIANHYRDKAKFPMALIEESLILDPNPNQEESQGAQSELETIKLCLAKLPDEQQNVIIWRYLDGFSNKEIAKILEKEEGTVRVIIHRALKEIKGKMTDIGL